MNDKHIISILTKELELERQRNADLQERLMMADQEIKLLKIKMQLKLNCKSIRDVLE